MPADYQHAERRCGYAFPIPIHRWGKFIRTADSSSLGRLRAIPSLDGLRAVAVGAVILSHFNGWAAGPKAGPLRSLLLALGQGGLGVNAFFIISGFLITTLLLEEQDRTGTVHLGRFYLRRSLRIFPAFYVYLLTAAAAAFLLGRAIPANALVASAAYFSDYLPYTHIKDPIRAWYVAHTWSLSVEEQFYFLWPVLLVRLSRGRAMALCVWVVLLTPLLRLATVLWLPVYGMAEQWYRVFHTNADVLALGCLLAFVVRERPLLAWLERCFRADLLIAVALGVVGSGFLLTHAPPWCNALVVISLTNAGLALLILFFVRRPGTIAGRFLNWKWLRHVGLISYSLYLWQQLFLGPYNAPSRLRNVVVIFLCAEVSFWAIERPVLRLRSRWEARLFPMGSGLPTGPASRQGS